MVNVIVIQQTQFEIHAHGCILSELIRVSLVEVKRLNILVKLYDIGLGIGQEKADKEEKVFEEELCGHFLRLILL